MTRLSAQLIALLSIVTSLGITLLAGATAIDYMRVRHGICGTPACCDRMMIDTFLPVLLCIPAILLRWIDKSNLVARGTFGYALIAWAIALYIVYRT